MASFPLPPNEQKMKNNHYYKGNGRGCGTRFHTK